MENYILEENLRSALYAAIEYYTQQGNAFTGMCAGWKENLRLMKEGKQLTIKY